MKIVAIIKKDGTSYTVGIMPADLGDLVLPEDEASFAIVEEITFCGDGKDLYNKGRQNSLPAYLVKIATSDIRRLIPESEIKEIHADIESHKKSEKKVIPELPESEAAE
jgi:hypothetical protein